VPPRKPPKCAPYLLSLQLRRDRVPSFEEFPYSVPAIRHLHTLDFHPKVTYFIGENGSGKSTLLEAIAILNALNPEGGGRNFNFRTRESHSTLNYFLRLSKGIYLPKDSFFLRAESFYNLATEVERLGVEKHYGGKSLHDQSHGESFFSVFERRFRGAGLYILDEPEAALSPNRQLQFLGIMHEQIQHDSQFVIATHSPIVMAYPEATIYLLDEAGIHTVAYEDTEHFKVTRAFLMRREKMLKVLFEEEDKQATDEHGSNTDKEQAE
jgi:predicted ATPase